jgi:molybdenum cofactor cytidylyltransferase
VVATIVLAAGQGTRLGGAKALLLWRLPDGRELPLAAVHAEQRLAHESDVVLVVARDRVAGYLRPWLPDGAELLVSTEDEGLGPAGSIACAVRWLAEQPWWRSGRGIAVPSGESLALITPVDCLPAAPPVAGRGGVCVRVSPPPSAAPPP